MKKRLLFIAGYFLSWILFFEAGRLFFLLITRTAGKTAGFTEWKGVFIHGLRMDASTATYASIPVILIMLAGTWIPILNRRWVFVLYTLLAIIPVILLFVADAFSFNSWGHRLEAGALRYLKNPKEAWASVSNLPVTTIFIGIVLFLIILFYLTERGIRKFVPFPKFNRWILSPLLLIVAGLFIIPLRGGLQLAPINQSTVYFSENNYANQAALNPVWNFVHSIKLEEKSETNPFVFMDGPGAQQIMDRLFADSSIIITDSATRKNVIVVVWESFTAKVLDKQFHGEVITPAFNELKKEGIYFDNLYATGDRTDKGIVGVLSGYPSQPINSIVKFPNKTRSLPMLTNVLARDGYYTGFYYGGEPEFANIKSYLLHGRLDDIVDVNSFSESDRNSKWGAHDGVVMQFLLNKLKTLPQPFFATWLTLSSHEPYETPVPVVIKGNDDVSKFLNSLHYTDAVLKQFVDGCRQMPWWNNTILVIVADHGHRYPPDPMESNQFRIPLLLLGGGIKPQLVHKVGSQTDLAATLLHILGYSSEAFHYSRNILSPGYRPWAWFSFVNGFGFITDSSKLVYDNVGKRPVFQSGKVDSLTIKYGKALQQVFYNDFLHRDSLPATNKN